ncbi:CPBP family intramembrane metalloprotease [Scytonema hofmannii FACHB-248]|uniref:CPBP family intramembrane metalloprotease n=1 Tax=Scytonema hofmannii FACHB-248 TaxID=1842502 RepID=A0ABR8GYM7_9CYAN|nr:MULTISPECIES: CPBP family intramembrane glutamic endopeptidase [Nostocales]MBD2608317.1 CPBP family intramembrane metalloprotease [Scytonema hofmannii FACHB-248]
MKINFLRLSQYPAPVRLGIFILALLLLWLPIAAPIRLLVRDDNLVTILTMPLLYVEFILLLRLWGRKVYKQTQILRHYGLERTPQNAMDLLHGLAIGLINILILFGVEGLLGWLVWQKPSIFLLRVILEGLIVALAYGFAEELLFRGWLFDELQRDYNLNVVVWATAVIFAVTHFIKPLPEIIQTSPQFFGLLLLALFLVCAKRWRRGRLGLSIGLHAGLIWGYYIINVGQLTKYSGAVPDWVTGVNRNPLAGLMGLLLLSVLALWMGRKSRAIALTR